MKKITVLLSLAFVFASCSDDDNNNCTKPDDDSKLISPPIEMSVSTISGQSPLTGILTIAPCNANSSIYYGNYIDDKLVPFDGFYQVKDGTFYNEAANRVISLPTGTYNMVYWGTPKYKDPLYAYPAVREASLSIGEDLSKQALTLVKMSADTIYYPVYDLVYAVRPAQIGSESLKATLNRVVAGLNVTVKDKNNGVLSSSIDSMAVRVTNIYSGLNYYTGKPQGTPRTIAFPLIRSTDGTRMSNATVLLFPSAGKPEFQLSIILKNGAVKSFRQTLKAPLTANMKLNLTLTLGDIFSEQTSGDFNVDNWEEQNENIDVPIIQ